ncbi:MAG: phosphodiesterase [Clostridia bacterium]|nr:phosphodiesterase [Clostridia bacterium]
MKYIFVSDIHGNVERFKEVLEIFEKEKADRLVVLGDTSAYLSKSSDEEMAELINSLKDKIEIIRGNCDTKNLEELLNREMYDMDNLYINGHFVSITHGHYFNFSNLPPNCGEIFIQGHTHVPVLQKLNDKILANPGSVSRPRGVDLRCYILIDEEKIVLKTLDMKVVKEIFLD